MMTAIPKWVQRSRFTANVEVATHGKMKFAGIFINGVRLIRAKDYCGQHAGPCLLGGRKHCRYHYLEGADWVGFNDGLNSVLDKLKIDADVWSYNRESREYRYFIRRGRRRLTNYCVEYIGEFPGWISDAGFEDFCGLKAPPSNFPDGTPGIPDWRRRAEKSRQYRMLFEHHH